MKRTSFLPRMKNQPAARTLRLRLVLPCLAAAWLLAAPSARANGGADLGDGLRDGTLYATEFRRVPAFAGVRFVWVAEGRQLRIPEPPFTFAGLRLGETLVLLRDGKPNGLRMSVWNRGDDGALDEAAFRDRAQQTIAAIERWAGAKGESFERRTDPTKREADAGGLRWTAGATAVTLEWALVRKGARNEPAAEYLRLDALPSAAAPTATGTAALAAGAAERVDPRSRVVCEADGTTWLRDVPMVDQGQKGYCAAATVARIMGYYGYDWADQHQIAAWVKSDADRGTDLAMLKAIGGVLHDRYRLVLSDVPGTVCDLQDLVRDYNREAKRRKMPEIELKPEPGTRIIRADKIWKAFDKRVLRDARTKNTSRVRHFGDQIRLKIDAGIPIIWSVWLGIVPETPALPQTSGGHMRLILGYDREGNVLYSDSWGAGHERKKMRLEDALLITTGMRTLAPRAN